MSIIIQQSHDVVLMLNNVIDLKTTLYQRQNDVVLLTGLFVRSFSWVICLAPTIGLFFGLRKIWLHLFNSLNLSFKKKFEFTNKSGYKKRVSLSLF